MLPPQVSTCLQDIQQKFKAMILPEPCRPWILHCNRWLVNYDVGVHSVYMLVVVVQRIWVLEGYPLFINCTEFVFAYSLISPICGNQNDYIVFLFCSKYTMRNILKLTTKWIHYPNTFVNKVSLYFFIINIVGPVLYLLDKSGSIDYFFFINTNTRRTQKPQYNTTTLAVLCSILVRHNINDTAFPRYKYVLEGHSSGLYLSSTNPTKNKIPDSEQETVWH